MMQHQTTRFRRRGLSLAEVIMASVIVSFIMVSAMNGLGGALKAWNVCDRRGDAYGLAEELMAEIMQQAYKEPGYNGNEFGINSGESSSLRTAWDDVNDYNGWLSAPQEKDGTALAGFSNWTRAVTVEHAKRSNPNDTTNGNVDLTRITVTVTDPDGATTQLFAWRSEWGLFESSVEPDMTSQVWMRNQLTIGSATSLENGTPLLNRPE